jgi:hypothetical protein
MVYEGENLLMIYVEVAVVLKLDEGYLIGEVG